jgi:hypothetical protein
MNLEIVAIHNQGNLRDEFVELKAKAACQLQNYMVADADYDTSFSNKLCQVYWFYPKEVKEGDIIHLHTEKGDDISTPNVFGSTTHIIHWGLEEVVWNTGDVGVLFELNNWSPKKTG